MNIAILGCGNMGKALIGGLQKSFGTNCIITAFDQNPYTLTGLPQDIIIKNLSEWFSNDNSLPDAIIIAVKPADIESAVQPTKNLPNSNKPLWISIAAGVTIASLNSFLSSNVRVCRVMPNTPALIGEGMSAFSLSELCSDKDLMLVQSIMNSCGKSVMVPEKLMDGITGLSGSGPAYVLLFIEALIEGGVTAGLPFPIARDCAIQTVFGTAKMLSNSTEHPASLKMNVMSPGGTTAFGCKTLEKYAFKHAVIEAVCKASERSKELGAK